MTAAIYRSTPSLSVPQTQNTAPVYEFACLYTHDLRKKAKRWHDGMLRYHTFNKRAMVYDIPRNFIGDMHWTGEEHMQEGDEVVLEKVGVRVEVAERIGETETDLSELRAKKGAGTNDEPSRRTKGDHVKTSTPITRASSGNVARGNTQLKHKSLNALLGTPKGQMGKATLPMKSPFEERHSNGENEEWEDGRPAKKARVAETTTTTTTTKKTSKQVELPLWARTADSKADGQGLHQRKVFIDLSGDVAPSHDVLPGFSSDALAPPSPVRDARDIPAGSSSPAFQSRRSMASISVSDTTNGHRIQELGHEREEEPVAPVRRSSKAHKSPQEARQPSPAPLRPSSTRPGQTLRLATNAPKRRTLLCQDQLMKNPRRRHSPDPEAAVEETPMDVESEGRPKTAKERVQERLRQINKRKARNTTNLDSASTGSSMFMMNESGIEGSYAESVTEQGPTTKVVGRPQTAQRFDESVEVHNEFDPGTRSLSEDFKQRSSHEISAIELARLDRMMLPPAAPRRAPTSPVSVLSPREARPLRRVISEPLSKSNSRTVTNQVKPGPRRVPNAPIRYTPTPSPTKRSRESTPVPPAEKEARPSFKNKAKKILQKSVSLNMTAAGTSTVILGRPFQAPGKPQTAKPKKPDLPPEDVGPWSREAFDLFKWRPPGWDEEKWCVVETVEAADKTSTPPAGLSGGASLPSVLREKTKSS